jgi:8-oxo-dGTP pyrophosphatase MutT (NUDIX family)
VEWSPLEPYDEMKPPVEPGVNWRRAAVLILLYPRAGEDYIVFMRRTETVEHHKGQISLPGGGQDPEDADLAATALREADEELGIRPELVQVIGRMPDVYARVSSFIITPVVARLKPGKAGELVFRPSEHEVAEVIEVPLRALLDRSTHRIEQRVYRDVTYNVHYYTYGPYEIWGATGRIIFEFLHRLDELGIQH